MKLKLKHFIILYLLLVSLILNATITEAAKKSSRTKKSPCRTQTSLVVDVNTGKVLHAKNITSKIYPASLTKLMTLYMLFDQLDSGKLSLNNRLKISERATKTRPGKLFLRQGDKISVKDAILGMIVKSANDVSVVVAEAIGGSECNFAKLMTAKARELGMKNTVFINSHGWHHAKQVTTAADMAKLAMAMKRDFPQYYHFFSITEFKFKGKRIKGHNKVTAHYPGADGLKTGFTNPAGCNLVTSANRNGKSLIAIVTGSDSAASRDKKMTSLLDKHFGIKAKTIKMASPKKKPKKKAKVKIASKKG